MQNITLLGSTGSIGKKVLKIVARFPERFHIVGLSADKNHKLLIEQALEFNPEIVCINSDEGFRQLKSSLDSSVQIVQGSEGLVQAATHENADTLVSAIVGNIGLAPVIAAIKAHKAIKLANKEPLVSAGKIIIDLARKHSIDIIPIDSEHSAIFQCLQGEKARQVKRIILTASGGPFHNMPVENFKNIKKKEALNHPNWSMGGKITIDSSTMMNKGLEVIEAHWLFGTDYKNIDVVIHPQSAIHSMVEFIDASIVAQLGVPDMTLPIQYALSYPERLEQIHETLTFDILKYEKLEFFKPDFKKFPLLQVAYDCGKKGGLYPTVMNASNEMAVSLFLNEKISFLDISRMVIETLSSFTDNKMDIDLDSIYAADDWARKKCGEIL
ncbi:1-deoxy-D-xylulose-5-phosphate reductoisomerase [bacterium]|nr:1-deoxy-D-xylulose-5-phosphate reductoisomerase [bacterium]